MTKERATKATHTDKGIVRRPKRPLVPQRTETSERSVALESEVTTDWHFHISALMRISDNIVTRAVNAYDRLFGLDERDEGEIHFEFGKRLADEERLDEAVGALRKVLRTRPDHVDGLFE